MSKIEKVKKRKGFKPVGIFLFGTFFGLILTLILIAILGCWVYNSLSLRKIEKITNSKIDINKEFKSITIKDLVKNVSAIANNIDTYTIGDLEQDFDITLIGDDAVIPNSVYGLDLTILRNSTKDTIKDDFTNIIESITLSTVIDAMNVNADDLGLFSDIIDDTITYYYYYTNDESNVYTKPYSDSSKEKAFEVKPVTKDGNDYPGTGDIYIKIGSSTTYYKIEADNSVSLKFRNIPIKTAFNNFDSVINELKLYEVLEYTKDGENYYTDESRTEKVTGILATLADTKVSELYSKIKTLKLYEALGYTYNQTNEQYFDTNNQLVTNKMVLALATSNVENIASDIENLKVTQMFNREDISVLKLFEQNELDNMNILDLPSNVADKIQTCTIGELLDAGVVSVSAGTEIHENIRNATIQQLLEFANTYGDLMTLPTT